jgi:hypothetical protein
MISGLLARVEPKLVKQHAKPPANLTFWGYKTLPESAEIVPKILELGLAV